jgi:hypothetical protein
MHPSPAFLLLTLASLKSPNHNFTAGVGGLTLLIYGSKQHCRIWGEALSLLFPFLPLFDEIGYLGF